MKRCYYTILEVDKKATNDEIKQAYRKLAILWHPDKNRSEEATQKFQEINEAYSVLSDPNERTWYDNHRNQILKNNDRGAGAGADMTEEESELQTFGFDIWPYFSRSCYKDFDDSENGFYTIYRKVFELIKAEEEKAKHDRLDEDDEDNDIDAELGGKYAPGFGDSKMSPDKLLEFYKFWENFTTHKSFEWKDLYNLNEAYNRQVKRIMEKENKKERQKEKKKYIDTIKNLVEYVKKRDQRYQDYTKSQILEKQRKQEALRKQEEERVKKLQELREKQRKEEAERYRQQEEELLLKEERKGGDGNNEEGEESLQGEGGLGEPDGPIHYEDYYCEICDKEFKTDNQLKNHKQSKAHQKKVKEIYAEVALEEEKEELENMEERLKQQQKEEENGATQGLGQKGKKKRKKKKGNKAAGDEDLKQGKEDSEEEKEDPKQDIKLGKKDPKQGKEGPKQGKEDLKQEKEDPKKVQANKKKKSEKDAMPTLDKQEKPSTGEEEEENEDEGGVKDDEASEGDMLQYLKPEKKPIVLGGGGIGNNVKAKEEEGANGEKKDILIGDDGKPSTTSTSGIGVSKFFAQGKGIYSGSEEDEETNPKEEKKLNKAKLKRLKKQQQQKKENEGVLRCTVCKEVFDTRNKLFTHLKTMKHEFGYKG